MNKKLRNRAATILLWGFALFGLFSLVNQIASFGPVAHAQTEPRSAEELEGGLFVNITSDDLDRAAMAVSFATKVRNETGKAATIFLNVEGVRLADKNIPQNVHVSGKTIQEMLQDFMNAGGVVLVCPMCMKNVGGMTEADFIDGALLSTQELNWDALFAKDVTVLSY